MVAWTVSVVEVVISGWILHILYFEDRANRIADSLYVKWELENR